MHWQLAQSERNGGQTGGERGAPIGCLLNVLRLGIEPST